MVNSIFPLCFQWTKKNRRCRLSVCVSSFFVFLFSYLVLSIHFSDQGNLQGPKGLKAKRSREYFEVKHLGVEKKKRGRKRKSEYILPAEPNSILTRPLVDNGISLPGAVFTVVEGQTISATVATIAPVQNGSSGAQSQGAPVVPPPVVPLGSVSLGPPGYQGPPKTSVPRPINPVKAVPMLAPQGKLPMVQSHRAPVPINALPGGKPVMKEVSVSQAMPWLLLCGEFFFCR